MYVVHAEEPSQIGEPVPQRSLRRHRPRSIPASRVLGFVSVMPDAVLTVTDTAGLSTCEPVA